MATKYCGAAFDIHGGGLDLIFPHHENELAQSRAAGDDFAHYWMHNAWVTTSGEKMSKSLGNTLLVHELTQRVRPIELRYYIAAAHYRSMLEFSPEALDEAAAGFRRIESFVRRASERHPDLDVGSVQLPAAFVEAMNDDLGVPAALAEIHGTVTRGNEALQSGAEVQLLLAQVRAMTAVLGVDPLDEQWAASDSDGTAAALDKLVSQLLQQRAAARQSRDFAAADAVRDTLLDSGVTVSDGPDGSTWSLSPPAGGGDDPANGRL
jgi:cysteinyl-tRNA synthetase